MLTLFADFFLFPADTVGWFRTSIDKRIRLFGGQIEWFPISLEPTDACSIGTFLDAIRTPKRSNPMHTEVQLDERSTDR